MKINFNIDNSLALPIYLQAYTVKERVFHTDSVGDYCKEHSFYKIQIFYFCFEITGKEKIYSLPPAHPNCKPVIGEGG